MIRWRCETTNLQRRGRSACMLPPLAVLGNGALFARKFAQLTVRRARDRLLTTEKSHLKTQYWKT